MNYNHIQHHRGELRSRQQGGPLDPDGGAEFQRHQRRQRQRRLGRQRPARRSRSAARGSDNSKSSSGRTEETTNYEISKTVKTSAPVDGGDVKKLSVAVVVDGTGDTAATYKPRSAAEMAKITSLVKSAMGFDQTRGDQVQVTNMAVRPRRRPATARRRPSRCWAWTAAYWFKIIEAAIMCVTALLIGLFVARPLINRMFAPQ